MKQYEIISVYNATEELADNKNLTSKEQWALYNLRKDLRSHVEFQKEREQVITGKYAKFADENGKIYGENYQNYLKELEELNDMDIEWDKEKIKLPLVDGINFKTIEALEDFIEFII